MRGILVAGLGNLLMGDEGVGIHVLLRFMAEPMDRFPDVEFADLGTSMMSAVHAMADRRKAVFIDCALMGEEPGALRRFTPEDVRSVKALPRFSLHEGDLLQAVELSRAMGECPDEVVILGIEPARVRPSEDLSPTLEGRVPEYVRAVLAELD